MTTHVRSAVPVALIEAAQAGDLTALEHLLALAQPDVRRYARRTCRTASDIDDAAQEALFLVYRRVGSLRGVASFSGWLFRIVDRVCLRLARRALGLSSDLDLVDAELGFDSVPDADLRLDLATAIESLPRHYREVLLLRDVHELTIDEIAAQLQATRAATKARLHRARLLVREYLLR